MHSNYELVIQENDPAMSTVVPLRKSELTIGRKPGNTILLAERNVSRFHARLIRAKDVVELEDLNSHNGVLLNGQRITGRTLLREGDKFQIGDYRMALRRVAQIAATTRAEAAMPPPSPPTQLLVPVRGSPSQRRNRRVWLTLTTAGLGLLAGLLLTENGPRSPRPAAPISTQKLDFHGTKSQSAPPASGHREPASASDIVHADQQSDAAPKLRRRSPRPHLHDRAETRPAETAAAPSVEALGPPPAQGAARLEQAQAHYVHGEFAAAIRVARELTTHPAPAVDQTRAWRLLGAAACRLGDLDLLNEAYRRVDTVSRQYLQYVCQQANVTRSAGRFVLDR